MENRRTERSYVSLTPKHPTTKINKTIKAKNVKQSVRKLHICKLMKASTRRNSVIVLLCKIIDFFVACSLIMS